MPYKFFPVCVTALFFMLLTVTQTHALTAQALKLNQPYNLTTGSTPITKSNVSDYMYRHYGNKNNKEQYINLYKFNVIPGNTYTYFECQRGTGSTVYSQLVGKNPMNTTKKKIYAPKGFSARIWHRTSRVPRWLPEEGNKACDAKRMNFTVAKNSEHNTLYLVIYSSTPRAKVKVKLSSPADSNNDVKNSKKNKYRPKHEQKWGYINPKKIYLMNMPGDPKPILSNPIPMPVQKSSFLIQKLMNGQTITVVFDTALQKMNDMGWKGDHNDPLGAVLAGNQYNVNFIKSAGSWRVKGIHEQFNAIRTTMNLSGDPRDHQLNIMNHIFYFSDNGDVFDLQYGLVGHIN